MKIGNIRKIISLIVFAALITGIFTACSDSRKTNETKESLNEESYNTGWIVKPSISAQDISTFTFVDFNESTNHYDISYADCFRIMQNGKYGIIDFSGKLVIPAEYDDIFAIRDSRDFIAVKLDYNNEKVQTYIHYGTFDTQPAYKKYNSEKYEYYWNTSTNEALFVIKKDGDSKKTDFAPSLPEVVKGVVFEGNKFVATGSYGLYSNSSNITGMRYSGAGLFADGKAAFMSNNKWGYIDSNGRTVIPFEYDAVWGYNALGGADTPYESFNGYVTLCKDKKFGVMKDDGTIVAPFIYDGATPVVDGKLFVKTDGKWGVLYVDGAETEKVTTEKNEPVSESTTEKTSEVSTTTTAKAEDNEDETTSQSDSGYSTGTYVLSGELNLRSEASVDSEPLTSVSEGESVYVDEVSGTWGHISYDGYSGWINLKYIHMYDD